LDARGEFGNAGGIAIQGQNNDIIRVSARHGDGDITASCAIYFVATAAKKVGSLVRIEAGAADNEHPLACGNRVDRKTRFLSH
jgi:hypothetical protein